MPDREIEPDTVALPTLVSRPAAGPGILRPVSLAWPPQVRLPPLSLGRASMAHRRPGNVMISGLVYYGFSRQ